MQQMHVTLAGCMRRSHRAIDATATQNNAIRHDAHSQAQITEKRETLCENLLVVYRQPKATGTRNPAYCA
ncbi:MAG: hypothetical protein DHS20C16_00970 [Phycisphaerae bacterium]|nr:MAG: hypothetical protein DHS20C16_00970 [Phycisphaerae bacterium]